MKGKQFLKIIAITLSICTLSCAGCRKKDSVFSINTGNDVSDNSEVVEQPKCPVTMRDENGVITLENGNISLSVNKANGNISSVLNLIENIELIHGEGANFTIAIDPTTSDVFKADHSNATTVMLQSKNFTPVITTEKLDDNYQINLTFDLSFDHAGKEFSDIRVVNTIKLNCNESFFTCDYSIENSAAFDCVVINLTGAQMSGIKNQENSNTWSLFYPYKEGKLYENITDRINSGIGVGTKMQASYPSPMSMQLLQLYNEKASFDYSVLDPDGIYKEFNFGKFIGSKEYDAGSKTDCQISMSCTQYPYVKNGNCGQVHPYRIGIGNEGGWYEGADRYREFLVSSGMTKVKNSITSEWTGMTALIAQSSTNNVFASYEEGTFATCYADWITQSDNNGIDTLCAIGWSEGGFDHNYPDYEFSAIQGGENAFGDMVQEIKANKDNIICYINAHIADKNSNFAKESSSVAPNLTKLYAGTIKKSGFSYGVTDVSNYEKYMYYETYDGGLSSYAMSPASKDFQDAIIDAVQRLANKGVTGIWFDQLMEMPAYLDYDSCHGHTNPATAYAEGYKTLLEKCCEIMEKATNGNYIFVCEGVCDAYIKYIDCCGMMWGRKLGSTDTTMMNDKISWTSEITRYTMPTIMLGLGNETATSSDSNEFSRAFVMGNPILSSGAQSSSGKIINIYNSAKKIYFEGRYLDQRGLSVGSEDVIASLILGSDGTLGLQIYNNSENNISSMNVVIDTSDIGLAGKQIKSIINLTTGKMLTKTSNNSFTVNINALAIGAYKIVLE